MKAEIRDMLIPDRRKTERTPPLFARPPRRRSGVARFLMWAFAACILFIIVFAIIPGMFAGAKVSVTPRLASVTVDHDFQATKGEAGTGIRFEIMKFDDSAFLAVPVAGTETVSEKARGTIVVYNAYSADAQRLVATTRFRTSGGKIYRIESDVTVPGTKTDGGVTTPGSVEVAVVADEPGADYNIGLSDFTIPGFEGTPRYDKFFARSKTEMTGGFAGVRKTASENDMAAAKTRLEGQLREQIMRAAVAQTPATYMLYTDPSLVTISVATGNATGTDSVEVAGRATIRGILIDTRALARSVAAQLVPYYKGEEVSLTNVEQLSFVLSVSEPLDVDALENFTFHLKGAADIEWLFDESSLKQKLAGIKKGEYGAIFSEFPGIERASVAFSPVWATAFPRDARKITIARSNPRQ